jgi:hypothetical protein
MTIGFFDHQALKLGHELLIFRPIDAGLLHDLEKAYKECFGSGVDLSNKLTGEGVLYLQYLGTPLAIDEDLYKRAYSVAFLAHRLYNMSVADKGDGSIIFPKGEQKRNKPIRRDLLYSMEMMLMDEVRDLKKKGFPIDVEKKSMKEITDQLFHNEKRKEKMRREVHESVEKYLMSQRERREAIEQTDNPHPEATAS